MVLQCIYTIFILINALAAIRAHPDFQKMCIREHCLPCILILHVYLILHIYTVLAALKAMRK